MAETKTQTFGTPISSYFMCGECGEQPAPTNEDNKFRYVLYGPEGVDDPHPTVLCLGCAETVMDGKQTLVIRQEPIIA